MFYSYNDKSVKLTGRWGEYNSSACSTAPGSFFTVAFCGECAVLHFDVSDNIQPRPHLYISVDSSAAVECSVDRYIRIKADGNLRHTVKVIYKSAVEMQHRWHTPLIGKVSFLGYEAEANADNQPDSKKTIEFVGDSITEGVLIDEFRRPDKNSDQNNRVYQDDSTATYAYLTAQELGLTPLNMGYGAVGVTHGGCGGVPKAAEAYPYCFEGCKVSYSSPDYILINHGANDRGATADEYIADYRALLDTIRAINPTSQIIALSAFCKAYPDELGKFINEYNKENSCRILFIDSTGWVEPEPLHPPREGHKIIAEKLCAVLREELNL